MIQNNKPRLFYGYIVITATFFLITLSNGGLRSFAVFLEPMLSEFGWSRTGISGAFTLCLTMSGIFGIIAGRLTDRFGPRLVVTTCGILVGGGLALISQVGAIWHLYLFYGVIVGIGISGFHSPLMSLVARWFVKRRALIAGILTAGLSLGIAVLPPLSSLLISAYGWRVSYIALGGVLTVLVVIGAQFLRRDPGQMGLLPYGADVEKAGNVDLQAIGLSLGEAIRTAQFWLVSLISFCHFFLANVFLLHIVIYAVGLGISVTVAASLLSVGAGVALGSRIIIGGIADRIGNRRTIIIVFAISVAAFSLLLVARELWMLYLFTVMFGLGSWSANAMIPPLSAEVFGLKRHGAIIASTGLVTAAGGAIGPLVAGIIYDVTGSYQLAFVVCIVICIIAIVAAALLRPIRSK
ncbi:MFS transporter [Chloroflexota bacterium]